MRPSLALTLTIPEAASALGIGKNTLYDAVRRGDIQVLRIGRRVLIPRAVFERLLGLPVGANSVQVMPPTPTLLSVPPRLNEAAVRRDPRLTALAVAELTRYEGRASYALDLKCKVRTGTPLTEMETAKVINLLSNHERQAIGALKQQEGKTH